MHCESDLTRRKLASSTDPASLKAYFVFALVYYTVQVFGVFLVDVVYLVCACAQAYKESEDISSETAYSVLYFFMSILLWGMSLDVCLQFILAVNSYKHVKSLRSQKLKAKRAKPVQNTV